MTDLPIDLRDIIIYPAILDVAKYILAAVLGIALVFVIYSLAQLVLHPHSKHYRVLTLANKPINQG